MIIRYKFSYAVPIKFFGMNVYVSVPTPDNVYAKFHDDRLNTNINTSMITS